MPTQPIPARGRPAGLLHCTITALSCCTAWAAAAAWAQDSPPGVTAPPIVRHSAPAAGEEEFLPVEQAFRLYVVPAGAGHVRLNWQIADGYYLYRARIRVGTPDKAIRLGALELPAGQVKNDEYFGRQIVYHHEIDARLPVTAPGGNGGTRSVPLRVTYQGCAQAGLCYPPVTREITVQMPVGAAPSGAP